MNFTRVGRKQIDPVIGFEIIAFISALILILIFPADFIFKMFLSPRVLILGVGGAILSYLLLILLSQSTNLLKDIRKFHIQEIGQPISYKYFWYPILVSFPEELLFRLALPTVIFMLIPIWSLSVFLASVLFGVAHFRKNISPLVPVTAFAIGVVFAIVYELSGKNILAPIVAHFVFTIFRVSKFAGKY